MLLFASRLHIPKTIALLMATAALASFALIIMSEKTEAACWPHYHQGSDVEHDTVGGVSVTSKAQLRAFYWGLDW